MTTTINDRLIPTAYQLAAKGDIAQQDQFAQLYLDTEQGKKFRDLCLRVRQAKAPSSGQRLLDEVVRIITPAV